jgi:hypothetical protein
MLVENSSTMVVALRVTNLSNVQVSVDVEDYDGSSWTSVLAESATVEAKGIKDVVANLKRSSTYRVLVTANAKGQGLVKVEQIVSEYDVSATIAADDRQQVPGACSSMCQTACQLSCEQNCQSVCELASQA